MRTTIALIAFSLLLVWTTTFLILIALLKCGVSPDSVEPILNGSPQVVLLALVVALSGYLRQVYSRTLEIRDTVRVGDMENYPLTEAFTREKVMALENNCRYLKIASPLLLILGVVLAFRLVVDSIYRTLSNKEMNGTVAHFADVAISEWFLLLLLALGVVHISARIKDDKIRGKAKIYEDRRFPMFSGNNTVLAPDIQSGPQNSITSPGDS